VQCSTHGLVLGQTAVEAESNAQRGIGDGVEREGGTREPEGAYSRQTFFGSAVTHTLSPCHYTRALRHCVLC